MVPTFLSKFLLVDKRSSALILFWAWTAVVVLVGFRYEVGGDWFNYLRKFDYSQGKDFVTVWHINKDIGYAATVYLANLLDVGLWFPNLICAFFFSIGLFKLNLRSSNSAIFFFVCLPYLIFIVAMGYTRQSAALGLVILAATSYFENKKINAFFYFLLAVSFHKFAFFTLILVIPPFITIIGACTLMGLLSFSSIPVITTINIYLFSDYKDAAQGANVRAAMSAIAGVYYLYQRKNLDRPCDRLFTKVSYYVIFLYFLSFFFETASDRFGLYFMFIQPVAFSEFNFRATGPLRTTVYTVFVLMYFLVVLVWFSFSENAGNWLPYQTYPL